MNFQAPPIAQTLDEATPALEFEFPLESGDPRWTDLAPARGVDDPTARVRNLFRRQPSGRTQHVVFASHRGAGKSTELKRLTHQLRDRYFAIYFEANVEMDANDFAMEDLLLVIVRVVEEEMRARGTPLDSQVLENVEKWFGEVVFNDEEGRTFLAGVEASAKAEGGVPFFAKLMASVTSSLRVESKHRTSVKTTLKQFPGTLMTHVNNVLAAAGEILRHDGLDLLILIDNMDRYEPRVIDTLLVHSADRFKSLACNLIVTPPISLVLRPQSQSLETVFRCETMPTVKMREKHQGHFEPTGPGRDVLLEALRKRIDVDRLIPDPAAQTRLALASGGAIREFLEMAQDATLDAAGDTITLADVNRTLERRRQRLRDRIDANGWWDVLVDIARKKRLATGDQYLEVLFQRLAFQYNGEIWYDVHPLVSELPDFQRLISDARS
ncbi:MAG TPA: hypothetical protein VHG08_14610 [Longimicrobium sp.]|nr:hypothetical protein [Longimicrobium sp.]